MMGVERLWLSIRSEPWGDFVRDHLCISGKWFVLGLITWSTTHLLDDQSYWEGILQTVAVLYINLAGLYALLVGITALPTMRMAGRFGVVVEPARRLALHASNRFQHIFQLGAIAIGVLCAQLAVAFRTAGSLSWRDEIVLLFIVVALGVFILFDAVTWVATRTFDIEKREPPVLDAIQRIHPVAYTGSLITCVAIVIGVILSNGG